VSAGTWSRRSSFEGLLTHLAADAEVAASFPSDGVGVTHDGIEKIAVGRYLESGRRREGEWSWKGSPRLSSFRSPRSGGEWSSGDARRAGHGPNDAMTHMGCAKAGSLLAQSMTYLVARDGE
jgi:hypothetical protein